MRNRLYWRTGSSETLLSAWCADQTNLCSSAQALRLAAANTTGRDNSKAMLAALEMRAINAAMLIS